MDISSLRVERRENEGGVELCHKQRVDISI